MTYYHHAVHDVANVAVFMAIGLVEDNTTTLEVSFYCCCDYIDFVLRTACNCFVDATALIIN